MSSHSVDVMISEEVNGLEFVGVYGPSKSTCLIVKEIPNELYAIILGIIPFGEHTTTLIGSRLSVESIRELAKTCTFVFLRERKEVVTSPPSSAN
ncbi:hypothetical protein C4588_01060 [Candidatus Parcubacteria bacterium]|nr:MAG: hypothetical protein C4588_01060 [Candidatus Parcubacteria bacterium]